MDRSLNALDQRFPRFQPRGEDGAVAGIVAPRRIRAVYQPALNEYNARVSVQLMIEHWDGI